ncbi:hypothetical protein QBC41DRAFT_45711 [Cercophora samala]|uniref:Uncharacterized protein n=1 Tax=Cercophora samala TaxID=330535 RepID=A0AA39ZIR7_9PEZI|nr:hypothetical protein QBC41DRAFT_45711 [Cercophora samala]
MTVVTASGDQRRPSRGKMTYCCYRFERFRKRGGNARHSHWADGFENGRRSPHRSDSFHHRSPLLGMTGMHCPPPSDKILRLLVPVSAEQGPGRGRRSSYRPFPAQKENLQVLEKARKIRAPPSPPLGSILPIIFLAHIFFALCHFFLHVPQSEQGFAHLKQTTKRNTARRSFYSLDTLIYQFRCFARSIELPSLFLRGVINPPLSHAIAKIGDSVRSAVL